MYTFDSRVRYSETDEHGYLSIAGIVDYFQDTSTFQSEELGVGVEMLHSMNLVWVMSFWQIVIHEYPYLGDPVTAGTFPYDFKHFMGMRNFVLNGADGRRLVSANSVWTLMNTKKGVPEKIPADMMEKYALEEKLDMEYTSRKIMVPEGGVAQEPFRVERQHLDSNRHVNNGQYIHMAMNYLPADFRVGQMRAEYRRSALLGDEVIPVVVSLEDAVTVSLCGSDEKPFTVVEFTRGSV